jgi:hypothetical protein
VNVWKNQSYRPKRSFPKVDAFFTAKTQLEPCLAWPNNAAFLVKVIQKASIMAWVLLKSCTQRGLYPCLTTTSLNRLFEWPCHVDPSKFIQLGETSQFNEIFKLGEHLVLRWKQRKQADIPQKTDLPQDTINGRYRNLIRHGSVSRPPISPLGLPRHLTSGDENVLR